MALLRDIYMHNNPNKQYVYDFTGKRVKCNGKCMTKFSIGYAIEHNGEYYKGLLITLYDAGTYDEAKQVLLDMLEKRQFRNVTIVK